MSLLTGGARRRVFFSFHYQEDIFRVNQIRNSWRFGHENEREDSGFFDASLWERSRRESPESLKRLIRDGLKNTSVTCVLAGEYTYQRRWVRYEIAQSIVQGNGLFVVGLNGLQGPGVYGAASLGGPNPLDHMAVGRRTDGRLVLYEKKMTGLLGEQWVPYGDYTQSVEFERYGSPPASPEYLQPLARYCRNYRYQQENGALMFGYWADSAARDAGR